jgi:exoribonuclease R
VAGRFERHGGMGIVVPSDSRIRSEVIVDPKQGPSANHNDIVVARITR